MPKQKGFTLVEILVSIALISLVGATVIPNLMNFNSGQQLKNVSSELKNTLKNAQSRATSNIKCNDTKASSAWTVTITQNPVTFNMRPVCDDLSTPPPIYQSALSSPPTITASSCSNAYPVVLTFKPGNFSYKCNDQAPVQGDFTITLGEDQSNKTTTIKITKGGAISEQ